MNDLLSFAGLSPQEQQVLQHSMSGLSDKEVAVRLGLSLDTVKTYWKRIRLKVGGQTRPEIIALLLERGSNVALEDCRAEIENLRKQIAASRLIEENYRAIGEAAFDMIAIFKDVRRESGVTNEYRCVYCNTSFAAYIGRSIEDVTGESVATLFEGDAGSALISLLNQSQQAPEGERRAIVGSVANASGQKLRARVVPAPDGPVLALRFEG